MEKRFQILIHHKLGTDDADYTVLINVLTQNKTV